MKHYIHISRKEETISAMRSKLLEIFPDEALLFPIVYNGKLIVFGNGETMGLNKFFDDKLRPFRFSTQQIKDLKKKMRNKTGVAIDLEYLLNIIVIICVWFYKERPEEFEFRERYGEIPEEDEEPEQEQEENPEVPEPEKEFENELSFLPLIDLKISEMSID